MNEPSDVTIPAYQLDGDGRACSHCGKELISFIGGYRTVTLGGILRRLCRMAEVDAHDCYRLVMQDGRPLGELREEGGQR